MKVIRILKSVRLPVIVFSLSLFSHINVLSQTNLRDSLLTIIISGNVDENNLIVYRNLASDFAQTGNYDSAFYFYNQGLEKSRTLKNEYWTARYVLWVGGIYIAATKYDSAEHYLQKGYELIEKFRNDSMLAQYHQNLGTLYMFQNKNEQAAENLIKSAEIMEKMGDKTPVALLMTAYTNLAGIFNNLKQPEKALIYDRKALKYLTTYERTGDYAGIYFNMAVTYNQLNDITKTKQYLDSALYFNQKYPNARILLNILGGFGIYYEKTNNIDSALSYHEKAISVSKESGDFYFFTEQAINAAGIHFKKGNISKATALLEEALPYAREYQDISMIGEIYKGLKEIAAKKGNYKEAFQYAELSNTYIDSAAGQNTKSIVLNLEAKYENEKKEKEIADLRLSNAAQELAVVKRNRILVIGGIASAALLLILGLLYRNSRQKRIIAEKDKVLHKEQVKFLERQQQVVSLQSMINGQETERTRIAKDLHDGLGGLFSTIKMHFSTLRHRKEELNNDPLFTKSNELLDSASEELRRIAHNMMPEVLIKLGLVQATGELCNSISAGKLLTVSLQAYGMEKRLNSSTEIMLFRIIQELLNNIIKHAYATEAIVQFNREDSRLSIIVEDNGRGFNLQETDDRNHAGLASVQSRVSYLNGRLFIDSQKTSGTTVMMEFLINEG